MTTKREYYDSFFKTIKRHDNPIEMIKRWRRNIKALEKGGELIPSYYKEKGKFRRVTREEEIDMLKDMVNEFEKRC